MEPPGLAGILLGPTLAVAEEQWVSGIRALRADPRARSRALAARAAGALSAALGPGHPFFSTAPRPATGRRAPAHAAAEARLARAAAFDPDDELVLEWTARGCAHRGADGRALGLFRRLAVRARSAQGRAAGLTGGGEIRLLRGRVADAVRFLERALALNPEAGIARVRLAVALALLPDFEAAAAEFERLERIASVGIGLAPLRAALGATPAFARLLAERRDALGLFRSRAPELFEATPVASGSALERLEAARTSAREAIRRGATRARSTRRFLRFALLRIARAIGYPAAHLVRSESGRLEVLASIPRERREAVIAGGPEGGTEVSCDSSGVEVRAGAPGLGLRLRSPHAWLPGPADLRFLEEILASLRERLLGREGEPARGLLRGFPLGLRGRSAVLLERASGNEGLRIRARAGRTVEEGSVPIPARLRARVVTTLAESPEADSFFLDDPERVDPLARAGFVVPVPFAGAPVGALLVESKRRDLGDREREKAGRFAADLGARLRSDQFREWSLRRFGEVAALPTVGPGARLASALARASRAGGPVLLVGGTGTGKEIFARAFHFESGRPAGPFVPLPCGGLGGRLLEAEISGFCRGAFTGADRDRPGLLEGACGGTLFLDEVSALPPEAQAALLRVLEQGMVRRLGESRDRPTDFRLVASTQADLGARAREGRFRSDLLHRLARFRLEVPRLRDRREEIPALVRCAAARFAARERRPVPAIAPDAVALLWRQDWPGNVRELETLLVRCFLLTGERALGADGIRRTAERFSMSLLERIPVRGPRAPSEVAASLRTARAEGAPPLGRAAELLGCHPDTLARAARTLGLLPRALPAVR